MNAKPVYYLQTDPRWGRMSFTSIGNPKQTIGSSGCGPTSAAMILATWLDKTITPDYTCKLAKENGFRTPNDGTSWGFFNWLARKYNIDFEQTSITNKAIEALKAGALVVCSMGPGFFTRGGHYILAWDVDQNNNIIVCDPNSTVRVQASKNVFLSQCWQYFIFKKKTPAAEPHWGIPLIAKLKQNGLISGDHDVYEGVTWGQLAKVTCNIKDYTVIGDVESSFKPYIEALTSNNVIAISKDENKYISWGELSKVVCNILGIGVNEVQGQDWARPYMDALKSKNIVSQEHILDAQVTWAELAAVIVKSLYSA